MDVIIMVLVFVSTILALVKFNQHAAAVFSAAFSVTFLFGFISEQDVVASFTNSGLLVLIMLLLASVAIEKTSLIIWLTGKISSKTYPLSWLKLMVTTILGSAFLNNTAVVSTLIRPIRNNPKIAASRLLIPLSYAAILGGTLTLIGTSTNLIVNSMLIDETGEGFRFFEFTKVGLVVIAITSVVIFIVSYKLPDIKNASHKIQDYMIDTKLLAESSLIGKTVEEAGLRHLQSLFLVEIIRNNRTISPVTPKEVLEPTDRLLFSGDINQVSQLDHFDGLSIVVDATEVEFENLTEVVIRPGSHIVGQTLKKVEFRSKFDAAAIAIKRDGESLRGKLGELTLKAGDFLVLVTGKDFNKRHNVKKNFITLSGLQPEQKLSGWREFLAIGGFVGTILGAAIGAFSLFKGLAILLVLLMATGCLTSNDIKQRLAYNIWLIVGSAIALSHGLQNTGTLDILIGWLNLSLNSENGLYVLISIYILTVLLTELVTNNAAAALMFPLAYSIATAGGYEPMTFILAVTFAANTSFISPYSYQTNLMVFNAGQYRLLNFIKAGLPVSLTFSISALAAIIYFYPLTVL
ncbi:SLC13 family permease [Psychrosphaera haliotis]|uniref:SLC13 family permease n=1 Tax=Psychrosphaera haliotis TaxID=555083 RepID=A0A6N8F597_9GAMM|nr:SLC13 family permease [Psychrosphaera haliotis]MUH71358.1 SLC13 family permease [Psychrosphaera haliotis]